jgi:hypothetical protein
MKLVIDQRAAVLHPKPPCAGSGAEWRISLAM